MKASGWLGLALVLAAAPGVAQPRPEAARQASAIQAAAAEARRLAAPGLSMVMVRAGKNEGRSFGREWVNGPPVTDRTIFQIASLTKPFTAIVVLRLAEQKRLSLDDKASRWLPWLREAYDGVTIRQLLNHTSGVPRDLRRENVDEFTIEEFRRRFLAEKPGFAPGTQWEYANSGYTLLSLIAERAGGADFGALLSRHIFRPAGMVQTRYRAPFVRRPGRARGYDWVDGRWQPAPPVYSGFGNSGIESTARDLARFAAALQARRLLAPSSYRQMLSPGRFADGKPLQFPFRGAPTSYGLGWFLSTSCGEPMAFHGGVIAGYSSQLNWATRRNVSAVALSNGKSGTDRIGVADKVVQAALKAELACSGD